jgi:hypothetical protein
MWIAHLALFRSGSFAAWVGLVVFIQTSSGSPSPSLLCGHPLLAVAVQLLDRAVALTINVRDTIEDRLER